MPLACGGHACSQCGKCCDWYYDGDPEADWQSYKMNINCNIRDSSRWYRRDGSTCHHLNAILELLHVTGIFQMFHVEKNTDPHYVDQTVHPVCNCDS
ncbi:unnamed protein product [Rotaria sp. Silwood1]|nr:unnamed protein product [Rotaria sp. Silwood1]